MSGRVEALLELESEVDRSFFVIDVEVLVVEDLVGGDNLVVENLVEVLFLFIEPLDAASGQTWVHGTVESKHDRFGEAALIKVVDATHAAAAFLSNSRDKLLIERFSDTEGADPQMGWQILHLLIDVVSIPDLSVRQDKNPCVLSELLLFSYFYGTA